MPSPFDSLGGKRALLLSCVTPAVVLARGPRQLLKAPKREASRLVFVCSGNICRSPFAAAYARSIGLAAASFGLNAEDGVPANQRAVEVARDKGIDLTEHTAHRLRPDELSDADLVLIFEYRHASACLREGVSIEQLRLLAFAAPPWTWHIHDPYGLHCAYFHRCFRNIQNAIDKLAKMLSTPKEAVS